MTVLEKAADFKVRSDSNTGLTVDPMDITFEDLSRNTVMIRVKIRNEGEHRSIPTFVRLESAPFGAFVPWQPLATLPVPDIEPGESRDLSVAATRPHPMPLGDFDRVPPMSVLTALNASPDEQRPRSTARLSATKQAAEELGDERHRQAAALALRRGFRPARNATHPLGHLLPPDLWELLGREQPHWAGNINVFIGKRAVERHYAKALRIYSGRTNMAMLDVGGPNKRDAYMFDLVGLSPSWKAALHNMNGRKTLVVRAEDRPVQEKQWVEATGMMLVMLAVTPPAVCEEVNVQVHVTRRSCQDTAVVEFNLDATAQGPGCYVV